MCGFAVVIGAGAVESAQTRPDAATRQEAVELALARRGPDGIQWLVQTDVIMAAARLVHWEEGSVAQPYEGGDGRLGVFNGELFNLEALQARVGMPDASEIEVLVAGLALEGPAFLEAVDGQFAAVVRGRADARFTAVRDRFGICPLYYSAIPGGTVLASNLASLQALHSEEFRLSIEGLAGTLRAWAPSQGRTVFDGIDQVMPGGIVTFDDGAESSRSTWAHESVRCAPATQATSEVGRVSHDVAAMAQRLEDALRLSVTTRLRSSTPVACLVSGGIDSTIVAALAAEGGATTGIGLVVDGDHEVAERQRDVADAVGLTLLQHVLTPSECLALFRQYVATRRVPLVRLGPIGMTALARRARSEGIRAVLSGEGADELFAGYDSYRILAARAGQFGPVERLDWAAFGLPEFGAARGERWARVYWRTLVALSAGDPTSRVDLLRPLERLLSPELAAAALSGAVGKDHDLRELPISPLLARRESDIRDLLGAYLLTIQGDHAWMEEGVELRPPYLSREVASLALSRPPEDFVSVSSGKQPVRELLRRLARTNPRLSSLNFAKAAFRVDASFLFREKAVSTEFITLMSDSPRHVVDVDGVMERAVRCAQAGTCSEAESMLFTFTASLGVLASQSASPD